MSTDYASCSNITKKKVLSAMKKLKFEIAENNVDSFCITNGDCYIWCYHNEKGSNCSFTRYGGNWCAEDDILTPIADELQVSIYSEHSDEYAELMGWNDEMDNDDGGVA